MNDRESVVKHLEMIQGVINRLGHNSFLLKGWSMTIIAAGMVFIARTEIQSDYVVLAFLVPVLGFCILDNYFIRKERLFRKVYDEVRMLNRTDFEMNFEKHENKPKCKCISSILSATLAIFYGIESFFVIAVFVIIKCIPGV